MADAYKRKKMEFYHLEQKGIAIGFCPLRPSYSVECPVVHDCRHCGWHPDVEEERKKRVREMLEEPTHGERTILSGYLQRNTRSWTQDRSQKHATS